MMGDTGTTMGEDSLWLWSRTQCRLNPRPQLPDHTSRRLGPGRLGCQIEEVELSEGAREMWKWQKEGVSIREVPMKHQHSLSLSPLTPLTRMRLTFPTSGVMALQQVMESWAVSEGLPAFQS